MTKHLKSMMCWQLWLTMAVTVVNMALILVIDGVVPSPDAGSYVRAVDHVLTEGFDTFRTPGYPLVIALSHKIFGAEKMFEGIAFFQISAFLLSVAVMWMMAKKLTKSTTVATVVGIFYGVVPGISTDAAEIMTESLTISFAVFFTAASYAIIIGKRGLIFYIVYFISLAAMFALRPSSMAMLAQAVVVIVALFWEKKPGRIAVSILTIVALAGPAFQFYKVSRATGVNTMSQVSLVNKYLTLFKYKRSISSEGIHNPELAALLKQFNESEKHSAYAEAWQIIFDYGEASLDSIVTANGAPFTGLGKRTLSALGRYNLFFGSEIYTSKEGYTYFMATKTFFPAIKYWLVPVALVLGCVLVVLLWRKKKKIPWFPIFLMAELGAVAAVAILYAPDSFDRLTLPAAPAIILLFAIPFGKYHLIPPYHDDQCDKKTY